MVRNKSMIISLLSSDGRVHASLICEGDMQINRHLPHGLRNIQGESII